MEKEKTKDLLFEILSEEIPARYIPAALLAYGEFLERSLKEARLTFVKVESYGTPRRLVFIVRGLTAFQPDITVEVRGPKVQAAYDEAGRPTRTLEGFARAQGVEIKEIKRVKTGKGEVVSALKEIKGKKTVEILPTILEKTLAREVFPKSMRWGSHEITFARPVHNLLALYGKEGVSLKFGDIKSGVYTMGHRFVSAGDKSAKDKLLKVDSVASYLKALEENSVVLDPAVRKEIISEGLTEKAREAGGKVLEDRDLLEEVTYLVECPVVVRGAFEEEFLRLPPQIIINAMRSHQRYFTVVDKNGGLLPCFLTVANTPALDMKRIIRGNEKVLRARLNDASFYFEKDVRTPLSESVKGLKGVIFQAGLGTSYEKVERFARLALYLGAEIELSTPLEAGEGPEDFLSDSFNPAEFDPGKTDPALYAKFVLGRAAMLCKADLVSGVVGEFPDLQGVMGGIYAAKDGEAPEVAAAVCDHYRPTSSAGALPATVAGAVISIADKLDTIAGIFAIGKVPTGAVDPYALRRQALGIIAIIIARSFRIRLDAAVGEALTILGEKVKGDKDGVKEQVLEFFKERLRNNLLGQGLSFDSIDAVLSSDWFDIPDAVNRIKALEGFKAHPACSDLVIAFKRVSNILKGFDAAERVPDISLFQDPQERELAAAATEVAPLIKGFWEKGDYRAVFETLASIKDRIDSFFDHVMVMVEDEALRTNRLLLLNGVRDLYFRIADLSRLTV